MNLHSKTDGERICVTVRKTSSGLVSEANLWSGASTGSEVIRVYLKAL